MAFSPEVKSDVKTIGPEYTPIQEEISAQTASKVPFLCFGTVRKCLDSQHAGRLEVDCPAFPEGPQPCDYVSPVGGGDYGFFALPGIGATVLVGQAPFADPPTKYFWMGCLYTAGTDFQGDVKTQPYFKSKDHDPTGRQMTRSEVKDDGRMDSELHSGYGCPNAVTTYGTNDLPDSFILKHPAGHSISLTDKKSDVTINEIKLKTAENKRVIMSDAPAESEGECIWLIDENKNQIRITSIGEEGSSYPDDSVVTKAGKNIEQISQEGSIENRVMKGDGDIEIENQGTGDIVISAFNGKINLEAATNITLECGASLIELTPQGMTIKTPNINLLGTTGDVKANGISLVGHKHIDDIGGPIPDGLMPSITSPPVP